MIISLVLPFLWLPTTPHDASAITPKREADIKTM